ncbi:MAG: FlgD immunoglobulin-like domain containing protein [Elusimicrobiales bacterium]|nr:FlgD immunoglobulin-like domain containing protein [Elusimicrobiales bacterium]
MKTLKFLLPVTLLLLSAAGELAAAPRERKPSPLASSLRQVRRTPSAATREAFRNFVKKQGKGWKVRYNPRTALPEAITGGRTARYPGTPEQAAIAFFEDNKELLKVQPASLRLAHKKEFLGVTHLQYQQYKDGLPVEFSYARVHVSENGEVSGYQGRFEPELEFNTTPSISEQAAVMAARLDLGRQLAVSRAELVVYPDEAAGALKLAWKIRGRSGGLWVYYIDAADGSVLYKYDDLRYACAGVWNTYGTSTGKVYAVSPIPGYNAGGSLNVTEDLWAAPVTVPLRDQYFWVGSYSSMTVTNSAGDYCVTGNGKVFSSLKGPYFAVTNFRGASAHYDNGGGQWIPVANSVQSPHPYSDSQTYTYTVTIPDTWTGSGYAFAKAMPRFTSFSAGSLDLYGSVNDADQISVKSGNSVLGTYIGSRTAPFYGAAVENPSYTVELETDGSGTANGFVIDISSYLVLTNAPGASSNPGSPVWSTATAGIYWDSSLGTTNALSEVNAFYHLNAIRRYFDPLNVNTAGGLAIDLSAQVPVMVHAAGDPDALTNCTTGCQGMLNAYYDLEKGHIIMGDGRMDNYNKYRSFALDGTIVRHEYIHLVMDKIYPIINFGEFGAISEGLSDYFALASFWREPGLGNQVTLGNFVGVGEAATRDLSGSGQPTDVRNMPDDWYGEVHEDGLILSQALYSLRNSTPTTVTDLGVFTSGGFSGQSRADVLAFAALFYFPDNFTNFYDAMKDACTQFELRWAGQCNAAAQAKIDTAFAAHGIGTAGIGGDGFETSGSSGLCRNNNGPECAADISSLPSLSATVYPLGDVDYYSMPLSPGRFTAELALPMTADEGVYYAYSMFLFDSNREYVTEAAPVIYGTGSDACYDTGQCYTLNKAVSLSYDIPAGGGRYYLVVSAAPNQYYGNSEANSSLPYSLTLSRSPQGSASASIYSSVFDNDELAFSVPYPYFPMLGSVSSTTLPAGTPVTGAELVFEYAQLRDHNYDPIPLTRTNAAGTYMTHVSAALNAAPGNVDSFGRRVVSSRVKLQPGFAARYPGIGTVYLEVFGRNHLGHVLSLGVSNAINLTANRSEVTAYNNIIGAGGSAIIKYEVQSSGTLSVKVYTQSGTLVRTVYEGQVSAGKGTLEWNGTNSNGGKAASGIYFVKTKGPGVNKIVKIAVVR